VASEIAIRSTDDLQQYLGSHSSELAAVASKYFTPERIVQLAVLCAYKNRDLLDCVPVSVLNSVMQAAALGLDLSPSAGEAYLMPIKKDRNKSSEVTLCEFWPGYQGLIKIACRSGRVQAINSVLVREGDFFEVTYSPEAEIVHRPDMSKQGMPITRVYAWARIQGVDKPIVEVMDAAEIEYIWSRSKSKPNGPRETDYGEMARKMPIRRLFKRLPKTSEMIDVSTAFDTAFSLEESGSETTKALPADNGSGFSKGTYASPKDTAAFLLKMDEFLEKKNTEWLDFYQNKHDGTWPDGLPQVLVNRWKADNHLVKWCVETGRLPNAMIPEGGVKHHQIGRLTAIVYHKSDKDRLALTKELQRYIAQEASRAEERYELLQAGESVDAEAEEVSDEQ
jgi:phage RecT family recombinase